MKKTLAITLAAIIALGTALASFAAGETLHRGDLDRNGKVLANEARRILRMSARLDPQPEAGSADFALADVNDDGRILANDARKALRISARLEDDIEFEFETQPVEDVSGDIEPVSDTPQPTEAPRTDPPTQPVITPSTESSTVTPEPTTDAPKVELPEAVLALLNGKFKAELDVGELLEGLNAKSVGIATDGKRFRMDVNFSASDQLSFVYVPQDDGTVKTTIYGKKGTNKRYAPLEDEAGDFDLGSDMMGTFGFEFPEEALAQTTIITDEEGVTIVSIPSEEGRTEFSVVGDAIKSVDMFSPEGELLQSLTFKSFSPNVTNKDFSVTGTKSSPAAIMMLFASYFDFDLL